MKLWKRLSRLRDELAEAVGRKIDRVQAKARCRHTEAAARTALRDVLPDLNPAERDSLVVAVHRVDVPGHGVAELDEVCDGLKARHTLTAEQQAIAQEIERLGQIADGYAKGGGGDSHKAAQARREIRTLQRKLRQG